MASGLFLYGRLIVELLRYVQEYRLLRDWAQHGCGGRFGIGQQTEVALDPARKCLWVEVCHVCDCGQSVYNRFEAALPDEPPPADEPVIVEPTP